MASETLRGFNWLAPSTLRLPSEPHRKRMNMHCWRTTIMILGRLGQSSMRNGMLSFDCVLPLVSATCRLTPFAFSLTCKPPKELVIRQDHLASCNNENDQPYKNPGP